MTGARRVIALLLLAGVMLIDGYDLNAMALAQTYVAPELGLQVTDFWSVHSAVLVGLGLGALVIAPLGDRFGRKPVIVLGCFTIAVATFATGFSASIPAFAFWRLITGIALGACLANVSALSSEIAPEGNRSTIMAIVSSGIAVGALIAGVTAPELVRFGGWSMLFDLPALIALALALGLSVVLPGGKPSREQAPKGSKVPLVQLLSPPLACPMILFASIYMVNAVALYMLVSWTPVVLPQAGFEPDLAVRVQGLLQGAGLVVSIGLAFLIDKWKPALTLTVGYAIIALSFAAIWGSPADPMLWSVLLLVAGGGVTGIHGALMALSPKIFPSAVLSSAIGMAVAISRIGAIAAPPLGKMLIDGGVSPNGYYLSLAVPVGLCMVLTLLLPRVLLHRATTAKAKA